MIAAPSWKQDNGAVYILYGSSTVKNILLDNLQANQGFAMFGEEYSTFGNSVAMLKDINGDGLDDFIVGAPRVNDRTGAAHVFYLPWSCPAQCLSCSKPSTCDNWVCPQNCKRCSGPNICEAWDCPDKCIKCSSQSTCDVWRCPENCVPCTKPDVCDACISGFAFIKNKCEVCPSDTHFVKNDYCFEIFDKWGPIKNFFGGIFG